MNVIIDLEHTISDATHRMGLKHTVGLDSEKFQLEFVNDRPNENVIMFVNQLLEMGSEIFILSAKKEEYRDIVVKWLSLHSVFYDHLYMMPDDCVENSSTFKSNYVKNSNVRFDFALDDVGSNCAAFYENEIPCLRIVQ